MIRKINEKKNKTAVCVVGDYKFLKKHLSNFVSQVRNQGRYKGDIIILTSHYTPIFLLKLKDRSNLKFIKFNKITFDKTTDKELSSINTNGQPNRHIFKNFQWHKLHLFDIKLKQWKYIFYIDINMTIHKDINPILDRNPEGCVFANRDANDQVNWELKNQFDTSHKRFEELSVNYNLSINNYFQTGIMYFDTNIIQKDTKEEILKLVKKYPITRTNEQAILNLYFIYHKNFYEQFSQNINNVNTYTYWKNDDNTRITKQLVPQFK